MFSVYYDSRLLHFKLPAGTSRGIYTKRQVWYVTLRSTLSRSEVIGIGECAPLRGLSCDDMLHYEEVLSVVCQEWQTTGKIPYHLLSNFPSILMGCEMALHSYQACLQTGNPFILFDTPFSRGEEGIPINGLVWMGSQEEMHQRMRQKIDEGFRCIKFKIGAIDFEQELQLLHTMRQQFSSQELEIRVDANGAFSPQEALQKIEKLASFEIHSIEQPIAPHQWEVMSELCTHSPIPIALDEELIGLHSTSQRTQLLDIVRPQYIILKPSLHGGFSGAEEWMNLANQRQIQHWVTSALESNIGLNAIAQWCAFKYGKESKLRPQGLGTGQLFINNDLRIQPTVENAQLWCSTSEQREYEKEIKHFYTSWHSSDSTIEVQTSGSTGTPKTMKVLKSSMKKSAQTTINFLDLRPNDTAMLCLPLRYIAAQMMCVRSIVGKLRLLPIVPSSHPLQYQVIPPFFIALTPMQALITLQTPNERELLIRTPIVIIGGGHISSTLFHAVQDCQGKVYSTYGMTETLSHIAMRRLNGESPENFYTPLMGVRVWTNENQCLQIAAPMLYKKHLSTNDIAEVLADGRFRILGRKDNVVCSGGIKLQLEEIEEKLSVLPCSFILTSVSDELLGEALTLLYVNDVNLSEIKETCSQLLTPYEYPKHYLQVNDIPLTANGKKDRFSARKLAMNIIRLKESLSGKV